MKKINLPSDYGDFRNKVILGIGALRCNLTYSKLLTILNPQLSTKLDL